MQSPIGTRFKSTEWYDKTADVAYRKYKASKNYVQKYQNTDLGLISMPTTAE